MSLRAHGEKFAYILIGTVIGTGGALVKERLFDAPEFGLESRICAPLVQLEMSLVSVETDENGEPREIIPLPNARAPINSIYVRFINVGKKPLEDLEVVLEFHADGAIDILDERYTTKPEKGFGRVEIVEDGPNQRTVQIALFNPGDELEYSAIGTLPVTILTYAKLPGLSFYQVQKPGCEF